MKNKEERERIPIVRPCLISPTYRNELSKLGMCLLPVIKLVLSCHFCSHQSNQSHFLQSKKKKRVIASCVELIGGALPTTLTHGRQCKEFEEIR